MQDRSLSPTTLSQSGGISPSRRHFEDFLRATEHVLVRRMMQVSGITQPKCFISYCWGPEGDERTALQKQLNEFKDHLTLLGAEVFLDVRNLETNINQFMNRIPACDFIFLIGTPALKARLEETGPNNLKTEFGMIEAKADQDPGCIIPLIFQGEGDFGAAFGATMPTAFITRHTILVRDCRQGDDEWTNPDALTGYIDALSGDRPVGVIPIIYRMQQHGVMDDYAPLRAGLTAMLTLLQHASTKDQCLVCRRISRAVISALLCVYPAI